MGALTSKDGDLLSNFDKIDESDGEIQNTSLHHHLNNNHDLASKKGKNNRKLPLEHLFGFCWTFEKLSEQLAIRLPFETSDLQDIFYTTLADEIKVTFDKLFFYVPIVIPDAQTQIILNNSIKKSFTFSFDSWSTDRKTVDTQLEY